MNFWQTKSSQDTSKLFWISGGQNHPKIPVSYFEFFGGRTIPKHQQVILIFWRTEPSQNTRYFDFFARQNHPETPVNYFEFSKLCQNVESYFEFLPTEPSKTPEKCFLTIFGRKNLPKHQKNVCKHFLADITIPRYNIFKIEPSKTLI